MEGLMTGTFTGGCACGAVRYACSEKPIVQLICHCRDCQRASGGAFSAALVVPSDRLTFSGAEPKHYAVKAESGRTLLRRFCRDCGSPVSIRSPEAPLIEFLHAGSLDDPSAFSPSCELWLSSAYPWHQFYPDTLKFDRGPPKEAVRAPIAAYFAGRN
jgi:hypothetical protein